MPNVGATISASEARLIVLDAISDILIDLATDDDLTESEQEDVRESMSDVAEMLLDSLHVEIESIDLDDDAHNIVINIKVEVSEE